MFPVICLGIYGPKGTIQQYIVFHGPFASLTENDVFSKEEQVIINNHSISVHYSSLSIRPDDSIHNIKQKIVQECKLLNLPLTEEEIYLFFKQSQTISSFSVFETFLETHKKHLNQDEQESIPHEDMTAVEIGQLMTNYGLNLSPELEERIRHSFENPDALELFSYEDWKKDWPWDNHVSIFEPLGQDFPRSIVRRDPLFSAHPFYLHYEFLKQQTPVAMNTTERELLMKYISDVSIDSMTEVPRILSLSMATTESVLVFFQEKAKGDNSEQKREQELLALYFPHLFHTQNIKSFEDWKQYHENQSTVLQKSLDTSNLDLFYELYETKPIPSKENTETVVIGDNYRKKGITSFLFSVLPETNSVKLPLEYLFRNLTATKEIPFIQYNPGSKQEILYRLYSEKMSQNGKKIPYLDKEVLKRWAKQIRNKKRSFLTLALFPPPLLSSDTQKEPKRDSFKRKSQKKWSGDLFLRIYPDGEMEVEGKPTTSWEEYSLETLLIETLSPIIQQLNKWIQSSGFTLPSWKPWLPVIDTEELYNRYIDSQDKIPMKIIDMSYEWEIEIPKILLNQLEQRRDWLSSAFYYTSDWKDEKTIQKKGGPVLTFRRVENFQSMETENQWIAYYVQQKLSEGEIIERLQSEHELSREGAMEIYSRFLQEFQTEQRNREMNVPGRGWKKGKKQIRVKNTNPGFPVCFQFESIDHCLITAENICDFTYLNTLQVYINGIYQLAKGLPASFQKRLEQKTFAVIPETNDWEDVGNEREIEESKREPEPEEEEPEEEEPEPEEEEESEPEEEEESEPEEEEKPEEEPEPEEEDDSSILSDLSELHYNEYEEEEEEEEKGGEKEEIPKSQAKLEKEILSFLESSFSNNKKSGGVPGSQPLPFIDPQYKNQNVSKYWVERMKKRDPGLFEMYAAKEKEIPNFKAYPRTCQINNQRQPILISEEERQRIDREHPGSYTYALPYKSNSDAPDMYYICPRYWCFKTGTSMTEEEVQQGKCGPPENAVPSNFSSSKVSQNRDTSLVQFDDKKQHRDAEGNYVENNPGFIKHDGICMPCCFKRARPEVSCEESRQVGEYTSNDYIITDETKRLEPMKWGFLPMAIQTYFQYFPNLKETMDGKRLKLHKPMILRYGVEQFPNQSFLGVMADWYTAVHKLEETITVQEFREVLSSAISLDQFLQYNNGSLVSVFRASPLQKQGAPFPSESPALITSTFSPSSSTESSIKKGGKKKKQQGGAELPITPEEVDYTQRKYVSSLFVQRIRPDTDAKRAIINETIASYENYLQFLKDPNSEIDPTYLWDVISQPNPRLFPKGLNLVLLSIPESDMTQNVDLVCPSIAYSSQTFDVKKEAAIVLLHNGFYEPVYVLERTDKDSERTTKFFLSKNSSMLNGIIRQLMDMVRETIQTQCSPKPSLKSYRFERPIYLTELVNLLNKLSSTYRILAHVWNYNGKIIGLQVAPYPQTESNPKSVVVPCFPTTHSPLSSKHEANQMHRFMDDKGLWVDFPTTLQLLRKLNKDSKELGSQTTDETMTVAIPCIPVIEVVEEDMIVGILTQTNQFIAIQPPVAYQPTTPPNETASGKNPRPMEKDLNTELMVLRSINYIQADIAVSTAPHPDPEREKWIRDVRLENKFYAVFRSTTRNEINLYENRPLQKQIMTLLKRYQQGRIKYREILNQFVQFLQTLLKDKISFIDFDEKVIEELYRLSKEYDFTTCSNSENAEPYCAYSSEPTVLIEEPTPTTTEIQTGGEAVEKRGTLLIPKKNRINETADNEKGYYLRLADELLRFPRIQNYLLFPTSYLNVQSTEYKIKPTEIILLQSVLVPETSEDDYFKNMKQPVNTSRYIKEIPYEFTEPIKSQTYSNVIAANHPLQQKTRKPVRIESIPSISKNVEETEPRIEEPDEYGSQERSSSEQGELVEQQQMIQEFQTFYDTCISQTVPVIGSVNNSTWKRMFPKNTKELIYQGSSQTQSFCCIMNLIYSYLKRPLPLNEMKQQLIEAYRPWITSVNSSATENKKKMMKILSKYNASLVKQWKNTGDWEGMFLNENYIFTELDFWVVSQNLQLPVILFTSNSLKNLFPYQEGVPPIKWLLLYPHRSLEKHYFIRPPSAIQTGDLAPVYHKIEPALLLDSLKDTMESPLSMAQQIQEGLNHSSSPYAKNVLSLETYLLTP